MNIIQPLEGNVPCGDVIVMIFGEGFVCAEGLMFLNCDWLFCDCVVLGNCGEVIGRCCVVE